VAHEGVERRSGAVLGIDWQIAGFGALIGGAAALGSDLWWRAPWGPGTALVAVGVLLGFILGFVLARPLKRDLRHLTLYAAMLARGQWDVRLPEEGTGELRYLMRQLTAMADSLEGQVEALRRLAEDRAGLSQRAERLAVLEERQRIARELHDTVSQELFALAMTLGSVRQSLPEEFRALQDRIAQAEEGARRAQATMRGLIRALRPVELGNQGLAPALRALLGEVQDRHGVATEFQGESVPPLPPAVEDSLFRVAQEAIANSVRHGSPRRIQVTIGRLPDRVTLEVADDGMGFDSATAEAHVGLNSMRERTEEVGGQLRILSQPGHGAQVSLWVPLKDAETRDEGGSGEVRIQRGEG
jgi:NarL family two-component system sensor histidine kinase LiaS